MWSSARACLVVALVTGAAGCERTAGFSPWVCGLPLEEPFVNARGKPQTLEHCGQCGLDCRAVHPSADDVACETAGEAPRCVIVACPEGTHLIGDSLCAADVPVLCMPCANDVECALADPAARCLTLDGGRRCGSACTGDASECADGFVCQAMALGDQCVPESGFCDCTPETTGDTFGCRLESPDSSRFCAGVQTCEGDALSACTPLFDDVCDGVDNNCDGEVDEGFLVDGAYLSSEHCGACNHPCVPYVPNMQAACVAQAFGPSCELTCLPGYVDLDAVLLNGCECERHADSWPPRAHGVDADCDGTVDDTTNYVYVAKYGSDAFPGTLEQPVATIGRGISIATPGGQSVFVAQGLYDEQVTLADGVSVFGGYRSDFLDRDLILYRVVLQNSSGTLGHPVLRASGITTATEFDGFDVRGSDALVPGAGSTAVLIDDSGAALALHDLTVFAGRGADGMDGASSAAVLASLGIGSISALDGRDGARGNGGVDAQSTFCFSVDVDAGQGGNKVCPVSARDVGGGDGGGAVCPNTGCAVGSPCANGGCSDFTVAGVCDFPAVYAAAIANPAAAPGQGQDPGIAGPPTYDSPTTRADSTYCDDSPPLRREGGPGGNGPHGMDGDGGAGFQLADGLFVAATGTWRGGDGNDGADGEDGNGGGGGTAGAGYDVIPGAATFYSDHLGGSGGGGGTGGCGAPAAGGGQGGGGSIGIAVLLGPGASGPTLTDVRVVPATAGDGGNGGVGAAGGSPGAGGLGGLGNFWCARRGGKGGNGGRGGAGGGGGGGAGGSISGIHVVPLPGDDGSAYLASVMTTTSVDPVAAPARGGSAGYSPAHPGTPGVDGSAEAFRLYDPP